MSELWGRFSGFYAFSFDSPTSALLVPALLCDVIFFLTPLLEVIPLTPLLAVDSFDKDQLTVFTWICFQALYSTH